MRKDLTESAGMVDITEKPVVKRWACASGIIHLKESSIDAVRSGTVQKGDVLTTARIAAIQAVKDTPRIVPMCHTIPITSVDVDFNVEDDAIEVKVAVTSFARTGVEMEALTGVSVALLNIWDMVKSLEKDETGNYPTTSIEEIRVEEKRKDRIS
jgi:cyclic pyranopterin phosphate synthase